MLKFLVFKDGKPAEDFPIRNAYFLGSDGNAMRGDFTFDKGVLYCDKRETGVAAIAMQLDSGACGLLTLQTCLLPEQEEPYLLNLELARQRVMKLYSKSEDWGMFDLKADHPIGLKIEQAKNLFIEAICLQLSDPAKSDAIASKCLEIAISCGEELAIMHADLLLARRRSTRSLPRYLMGSGVNFSYEDSRLREAVLAYFDFIQLSTSWKNLAPEEGEYRWKAMDQWVNWANENEMPIVGGPLISFEPASLPDWLFIWEHDYETVRDLVYEHIERIVTRYKGHISNWNVVSGLHINNHFTVAFDQLMDLTRMAAMVIKKTQPTSRVLVEIRQPFGEYYGTNQRSIPPMMYADLLIQGNVPFDAFSLKLLMGQAQPGQFTRDLMQISSLLDQFAPLGKPINVVLAAPSGEVTADMIVPENGSKQVDANCGYWRKPWSPELQSEWLEAIYHIALSKPFVETVIWNEVMDHPEIQMPLGGLVTEDMKPKIALKKMVAFRQRLVSDDPSTAPNLELMTAKK